MKKTLAAFITILIIWFCPLCSNATETTDSVNHRPPYANGDFGEYKQPALRPNVKYCIFSETVQISFVDTEGFAEIEVIYTDNSVNRFFATTAALIIIPIDNIFEVYDITVTTEKGNVYIIRP